MNKLAALLLATALISPAFADQAKKPETTKVVVNKDGDKATTTPEGTAPKAVKKVRKHHKKAVKKAEAAPVAPAAEKMAMTAEEKAPEAAAPKVEKKVHKHHKKCTKKVRTHEKKAETAPAAPAAPADQKK